MKRIIPILLIKDGIIVKSERFDKIRPVSSPQSATHIFNDRGADELIILDIDAQKPNLEVLKDFTKNCFMPLTIGGGIRKIEDIKNLLEIGADKVAIRTAKPLIRLASQIFGKQCIVGVIDYSNGRNPVNLAKRLEASGCGEILLQSVNRDGTYEGFDIKTIKKVREVINIPLIVCGGAGKEEDFKEAIECGADAVCAGSIYLFRNITPTAIKRYLDKEGILIRKNYEKTNAQENAKRYAQNAFRYANERCRNEKNDE